VDMNMPTSASIRSLYAIHSTMNFPSQQRTPSKPIKSLFYFWNSIKEVFRSYYTSI